MQPQVYPPAGPPPPQGAYPPQQYPPQQYPAQTYPPAAPVYQQNTTTHVVVHHVNVDDKCCLCFPIRTGLTILGVFSILWFVGAIFNQFTNPMYRGTYGILTVVAASLQFSGFLGWMANDTQESRHRLHRFMLSSFFFAIAA